MPIAVADAVEVVREPLGDGLDGAHRPVVGGEGGCGAACGGEPVPERELGRQHAVYGGVALSERGRFGQSGEARRPVAQGDLCIAPQLGGALDFAHQVQRVRETVGPRRGREGFGRLPRGEGEVRHLERRERRSLHVAVAELPLGPRGCEADRFRGASRLGQ